MPQIEPPRLKNLRRIDPTRILWGTAKGSSKHLGVYEQAQLPDFVFRRSTVDPSLLGPALDRLERHIPIPGYFFMEEAGLLGSENFTNPRTLLEPDQARNRWRIMDAIGRAVDYLGEIRVGETFVASIGDRTSIGWGHRNRDLVTSSAYFCLDPLPTLASRESTSGPEAPFATAVGSLASTLGDIRIPGTDLEARETLAGLQSRVAQLA